MKKNMILSVLLVSLMSCNIIEPSNNPITYGENYTAVQLSTNKAAYMPDETVEFTLSQLPVEGAMIRYRHLDQTLAEQPLTSLRWTWTTPATDYTGYLVDIYKGGSVYGSIAVDVSSTPEKFVRNGFLSSYGKLSDKEIRSVMDNLNRYHINYVQFQDWHWKHHHPLAGTVATPMDEWTDIISRVCYRSSVEGYISAAHERNMKCLFYNLIYGALDDAEEDGVSRTWYLFKDRQHTDPDFHPLGSPFKSAIYLTNPNNTAWQDYLLARNDEVYAVFDFDGWQIDQLGVRGADYDYDGNPVNVAEGFAPMINRSKEAQPTKSIVMNAVGQYGQQDAIATAPVDFLYTEVWDKPANGFQVLSDIITNNDRWSDGKKTVLAAYMDYDHGAAGRGYFNSPGVIMATAAANAWGGTMLQLGEHMLCNEYFPDNNLTMHGDLYRAMIAYYDFITAYENLLRDGGEWFGVDIHSLDGQCAFNQWPPVIGQVSAIGKAQDSRDIVQLLSYRNAVHLDWSDSKATQGEPDMLNDLLISVPVKKQPKTVYAATPDHQHGVAQTLDFNYADGAVSISVPALKYWTMIVIEY